MQDADHGIERELKDAYLVPFEISYEGKMRRTGDHNIHDKHPVVHH
jgi:hypothetical protein